MSLNKHFQNQLDSSNCEFLPEDIKNNVLSDFHTMSQLDIDNNADQNQFFMVRNHVQEIVNLVFNRKLNDNTSRAIAAEVFRNRENAPIGTLLELIQATELALKKMIPDYIRPKIAYPQPMAIEERPEYDIGRWVMATREIYNLMNKGYSQDQAEKNITGNWEVREKMDYEQWLKFYKDKTPEKYPKLAAEDHGENLFLANLPLGVGALRARTNNSGKFPNPISSDQYNSKVSPGLTQNLPESDVASARDKIEGQRKKLISRLNSAEKMLASLDGQLFAGDDQELMLKLLQDLKRRIQIANKLTAKSSLFEDYIYRTANFLKVKGKDDAANFFYKIAQFGEGPADGGLDLGESEVPGEEAAPQAVSDDGNKQETYECLKEFFANLKEGIDDENSPEEKKPEELKPNPTALNIPPPAVPAPPAKATASIEDNIKLGMGYWHKNAQMAPAAPAPKQLRTAPPKRPNNELEAVEGVVPEDNTEDVIDAALKNVSINDVISRLEMLVSIYNKREIARQLAILDIMMDRIGLSSFFPALGEAMSKALESNQYIGSRLEGVLTKLKGSLEVAGASEWMEVKQQNNPETANIRRNLQEKEDEEKRRKEMRKQQDIAKMEGGAAGPDVGPAAVPVGESVDLQRPAKVERAPRIDVR